MPSKRKNLLNLSQAELEQWMVEKGWERYRARQILLWLYKKHTTSFAEMTDLPKSLRQELEENFYFYIPRILEQKKAEDETSKFLLELEDKKTIEAVLIPDHTQRENSLCLSVQVGCKFGCKFCYTAQRGFERNLTSGEILGQYFAVRSLYPKKFKIHRLVMMGMGEPLDNFEKVKKALSIFTYRQGLGYSPRRITISTAGIIDLIPSAWELGVNLAVSINASEEEKRNQIMPINHRYPLKALVSCLKELDTSSRQKLTAEYVLLAGFNDSEEDAFKLANLLSDLKIRINLIALNPFPGCEFSPPTREKVEEFQKILKGAGSMVFIRKSRGREILAGCGQLAGG